MRPQQQQQQQRNHFHKKPFYKSRGPFKPRGNLHFNFKPELPTTAPAVTYSTISDKFSHLFEQQQQERNPKSVQNRCLSPSSPPPSVRKFGMQRPGKIRPPESRRLHELNTYITEDEAEWTPDKEKELSVTLGPLPLPGPEDPPHIPPTKDYYMKLNLPIPDDLLSLPINEEPKHQQLPEECEDDIEDFSDIEDEDGGLDLSDDAMYNSPERIDNPEPEPEPAVTTLQCQRMDSCRMNAVIAITGDLEFPQIASLNRDMTVWEDAPLPTTADKKAWILDTIRQYWIHSDSDLCIITNVSEIADLLRGDVIKKLLESKQRKCLVELCWKKGEFVNMFSDELLSDFTDSNYCHVRTNYSSQLYSL